MAKIGEGYFQFSSKGLKELIEEINKVGGTASKLEVIGKSQGFFSNSILKDIGSLRLLVKEAKAAKQVMDQLKSVTIETSLGADRSMESQRAKLRARQNISANSQSATAASPSAMAAERDAERQRRSGLEAQRRAISKKIRDDESTTKGFKGKASALGSVSVGAESPAALRKTAAEIRKVADSLKGFKKGNVGGARAEMELLARATEKAALEAEKLQRLERASAGMSPERKGQLRGRVRDEMGAEGRAEDISGRQAGREVRSERADDRLGRRVTEIDSREDLTDKQKNTEVGIAAKEVADSLRQLAQEIREAPIDAELREAAMKFNNDETSTGDLKAAATSAEAKRAGAAKAGEIIDDADFRARSGGDSENAVAYAEQLKSLEAQKAKLTEANEELDGSENGVNQTVLKSIESDIKLAKSKLELTQEIDKLIDSNKELLATKARLDTIEAKGQKLTGDQKKERKKNIKDLAEAAKREKLLKDARDGSNRSMHDAAGASRRYNFQLQQASYGVQDFVQVIGQTGLSGALRASANNMASLFGASGTPAGAIIGGVGTIAMIGLAEAITSAGNSADSAEKKTEKLRHSVERFFKAKESSIDFTRGLLEEPLGRGGFSGQSGVDASQRANRTISESSGAASRLSDESSAAGVGVAGSSFSQVLDRALRLGGSSSSRNLAARKLTNEDPDSIKEEVQKRKKLLQGRLDFDKLFYDVPTPHMKKLKKEINELDQISSSRMGDPAGEANLALIVDPSNTDLAKSLAEFKEHEAALNVIMTEIAQSFIRLDESLSTMEANVADISDFDGKFAQEQADALAKAIAASARRIEIETEILSQATDPTERATREKLIEAENKVFNRYIESLEEINGELSNARVGNDLSNSMSAMVGAFVAARRRLEESLSGATPGQRQAIMAGFDDSQMAQLTQGFGDGILSFTGEVQRNLFETQAEANQRAIESWRSLIDEIRNNGIAADDALIPAIELAISKIGKGDDQENTSVTAIGGLHQKIQESLRNESDPDLDLQKEQRDLLIQIRDKPGPKVPKFDVGAPAGEIGADVVEIFGDGAQPPAAAQPPVDAAADAEREKAKAAAEAVAGDSGQDFTNSGQFSVPPPKFDYDTPAQPGGIDREKIKQQLKDDPDLIRAKEDLRKTQADYIDLSGARKEREQDANTKLKTDSQTALSNRNMAAIEGRQGPSSASTEESMARAMQKVQERGSSVNRRGGAVADFAPGLRGPGLTESQQRALSSPSSAPVPGESPEEQRKRRVAGRNAEFGPMATPGPAFTEEDAKKSKGGHLASIAGPKTRGKEAIRELIDSIATPDFLKAGPEINAGNVNSKKPGINPSSFAAAGDSAAYRTAGNFEAVSREADKAGIPISTPNQGKSERGLRTQQRRAAIFSGDPIRERAKKKAEEAAERYGKRVEADAKAGDKAIANEALRESGLSGGAVRSRAARERKGLGKSWLEKNAEANSPAPAGVAVQPLASNVQTATASQAANAEGEALAFHKTTAETLGKMFELMKSKKDAGGILMG
jgi:hypothetical protein